MSRGSGLKAGFAPGCVTSAPLARSSPPLPGGRVRGILKHELQQETRHCLGPECLMGRLTTHVLDTARGRPAAGLAVGLYRGGEQAAGAVTNADGRCDRPLLEGEAMMA